MKTLLLAGLLLQHTPLVFGGGKVEGEAFLRAADESDLRMSQAETDSRLRAFQEAHASGEIQQLLEDLKEKAKQGNPPEAGSIAVQNAGSPPVTAKKMVTVHVDVEVGATNHADQQGRFDYYLRQIAEATGLLIRSAPRDYHLRDYMSVVWTMTGSIAVEKITDLEKQPHVLRVYRERSTDVGSVAAHAGGSAPAPAKGNGGSMAPVSPGGVPQLDELPFGISQSDYVLAQAELMDEHRKVHMTEEAPKPAHNAILRKAREMKRAALQAQLESAAALAGIEANKSSRGKGFNPLGAWVSFGDWFAHTVTRTDSPKARAQRAAMRR